MRYLILAIALIFSLGNAADEIELLVDKGEFAAAARLAQAEAGRGDPVAHAWLGRFYENGEGVAVDASKAVYHYRIAAEEGGNYARWRIGVMIDIGTAEGTLEEAVALFRTAAKENYSAAIVSLGVMQATGRGTRRDLTAALTSYMRAARLGDSGGVRGVGVMFFLGEAVEQNTEEALAWFMVSAAMGNDDGQASFERVASDHPEVSFAAIEARAEEIARELEIWQD